MNRTKQLFKITIVVDVNILSVKSFSECMKNDFGESEQIFQM